MAPATDRCLADGRPYLAWGLSALRQYILLGIGGHCLAIIDSHAQPGIDSLTGLPVIRPEQLAAYDAAAVDLVIFADPERFGSQIRAAAQQFGSFNVVSYEQRLVRRIDLADLERRLHRAPTADQQELRSAALWIHQLVNGGAEKQIVLLACGLRQLGLAVTLITTRADAPSITRWAARLVDYGVERVVLDDIRMFTTTCRMPPPANWMAPSLAGLFNPMANYLIDHTCKVLDELRPDLLVAYLDDANLIAGCAALLSGVPNILLSGRNVAPPDLPLYPVLPVGRADQPPLYRWLLGQQGVRMFNNSVAGARSYQRWLGGEQAVIGNAVLAPPVNAAADLRARYGLPADQLLICGMMRLAEEKQPLQFVEVIAALAARGLAFTAFLFGDGALRGAVEERIAQLDLGQHLRLLGNQDGASDYLPQFNLLLLTSRIEGSPNVLLEAVSAGTPLVATDVGGVRDCLPAALHSQLVPLGDWPQFVERAAVTLGAGTAAYCGAPEAWLDQRSETGLARATLALTGWVDERHASAEAHHY